MKLIIGNKRLSSWSLRPWLLMSYFNIPFEEVLIPLDQPETKTEILKYSPSGFVPCLVDQDLIIHDSLAISEYLNDKFPRLGLWPSDINVRANARAISCEMHSGFQGLRKLLPHDSQKELKNFDYSIVEKDLNRIFEIWKTCLNQYQGPFLFGQFSIADAMFAPVVNRLFSYGVKYPEQLSTYIHLIRQLPAHQKWIEIGRLETYSMPFHI